MLSFKSALKDALHLFYPHICLGCYIDLPNEDQWICDRCMQDLPKTEFALFENNAVEKIFAGRIPLLAGHSEFYFGKSKILQTLMHQLKYKGKKEIGYFLGKQMGMSLMNSKRFQPIDVIVPVPMYWKKQRKRGYNQAMVIAEGVAEVMNIEIQEYGLIKTKVSETQTRKNRTERWLNADKGFSIGDAQSLCHKHVLLIDDVLTTGATLEACVQSMKHLPSIKISIATLAIASH